MTSLTLAAVLHASILAADPGSYAEARRTTLETGKPIVVMVGTDWCPPCQQMKRTVLPQVRRRGLLKTVAFAVVNADRERVLAQKLIRGGPIPQLVMFSRTAKGWKRRKLVGGQSVVTIERFIKEGLVINAATEKGPSKSNHQAKVRRVSTR